MIFYRIITVVLLKMAIYNEHRSNIECRYFMIFCFTTFHHKKDFEMVFLSQYIRKFFIAF